MIFPFRSFYTMIDKVLIFIGVVSPDASEDTSGYIADIVIPAADKGEFAPFQRFSVSFI